MLEKITKGRKVRPRRTVVYGVHGIGKSTFSSQWPEPIFIATEDGIADLDVSSFPLCTTLIEAYQAVIELGGGDHSFKTVVIDSADWLERLIWKQLCQKEGKKSIVDFGFGTGYGKAEAAMGDILTALNYCRDIGMHVIMIAHCDISTFKNPEGDSYDRYAPKLHKGTSSLIQEWADEVLFVNYRTHVRKTDIDGFNKDGRGVGVGAGERVIYTTERPGRLAKNRIVGLPEEIEMSFAAYSQYLANPEKPKAPVVKEVSEESSLG